LRRQKRRLCDVDSVNRDMLAALGVAADAEQTEGQPAPPNTAAA